MTPSLEISFLLYYFSLLRENEVHVLTTSWTLFYVEWLYQVYHNTLLELGSLRLNWLAIADTLREASIGFDDYKLSGIKQLLVAV